VVGTIDLDQDPPRHGLVNSWIPIIAAVVVGFVLVLQDWQAVRDKPEFGRYLFVDAVAAFVLTPLFVSAQLGLRGIATLELCRLIHSKVIRPAENGERPSQFGPKMDRRLDQTWVVILTALATVFYLIFELVDALNEMTSPLTTLLIAIALVVRVALFYLGVLTVIQIWEACRAIGTFLDRFNVNIHPLDPDSCGGLAVVAREVVDTANGRPAAEGSVGAVHVVPVNPRLQGTVAGGVGVVQPPIRPLLQQGPVEPLHLPVGLRPVGTSALVAHAGVEQRRPKQSAAVADPVVGQHPGHSDAVHGEPAVGAAPEPGAGLGPLITQDLHISQP
jgi:uncharacterized membrane protein (DUF485 family)